MISVEYIFMVFVSFQVNVSVLTSSSKIEGGEM